MILQVLWIFAKLNVNIIYEVTISPEKIILQRENKHCAISSAHILCGVYS